MSAFATRSIPGADAHVTAVPEPPATPAASDPLPPSAIGHGPLLASAGQPVAASDTAPRPAAAAPSYRICCRCGRPKPLDQFRPQVRGMDRRAYACNFCHATRERERRRRQRERSRRQAVDRFAKSMTMMTSRKRIEAAAEAAIRRFGGMDGFGALLYQRYQEAKPGSTQQLLVLLAVQRMSLFAEEMRAAEPKDEMVQMVTEGDIDRGLDELVANYIMAKPIAAIRAAAQLGWKVVPADGGQGRRDDAVDVS